MDYITPHQSAHGDREFEHMRKYADMAGIEFVHINSDTDINTFRNSLITADVVRRNK